MHVRKWTHLARRVIPCQSCGAVIVAAGSARRMAGVDKIMADLGVQSLQHILLSNFQFVKLFLYFISHNFIQSLRSNRKIGCSFLLPERRIFI